MRALTALPLALLLSLTACDGGEAKTDDTGTGNTTDDTGTGGTTDDSTGGTTDSETTGGLDGEALYATNCSGCHGADANGGAGGPPLGDELDRMSDGEIILVIQNGEGRMPSFELSQEECQAIVDYLRTLFP